MQGSSADGDCSATVMNHLLDLFKSTPGGFTSAELKHIKIRFPRGGYKNYLTTNVEIQKAFKALISANSIKKAGITGSMKYIYAGDDKDVEKENEKQIGKQIIIFYI